ncbi:MAG: type II secretion system F family protein [Candidatus Nanoarchaeia archaeon]
MEIKKIHYFGIGLSLAVIIISIFLIGSKGFFLILGIGILLGIAPFVFTVIHDNKVANEKEEAFLEFTRNLVESVKTGTPISKSIINVKNRDYGVLSPNIRKLSNQISLGIPLNKALSVFSEDINNKIISRAITLIGQAERAGGDIGEILESVAGAVSLSDKLKKERKAAISTLVVQGYIIFFIFMIIILVMQFRILPLVSGIADIGTGGVGGIAGISSGSPINPEEISGAFLYLLLIQGLFSGLAIGKLSEGNAKAGIKHSFVLMLGSFLVSAIANLFL